MLCLMLVWFGQNDFTQLCRILRQQLFIWWELAASPRIRYFVVCKASIIIALFTYACTYVLGFIHTYTLTAIFWIIYICHATISWLTCVHMCICIHTTCSYDLTTVKYPGGTYGHCYIFHDPFASFLHTAAPVTLIFGATYTHIMTFSTLLW